jgi:hypothetical protein
MKLGVDVPTIAGGRKVDELYDLEKILLEIAGGL